MDKPITLYLDIYPGMDLSESALIMATSRPGKEKPAGATRYAFTVHVDDPAAPDVVIPGDQIQVSRAA